MKHSPCRDMAVFDFNEEDELADNTHHQWSKLSNPKYEDPATKYQFLQYATTASVVQMKEVRTVEHVHVVAIDDDDDNGFISDTAHGPLEMLEKAGSKGSEGLGIISAKSSEHRCHFTEENVNTKSFSSGMEIKVSSQFRSSPGNSPICSTIPESPSSNGSVDTVVSDGHDNIEQSSSSTPASPMDENNVPRDLQAEDQSVSGSEMEDMDTIFLHTDYVTYCDKYFPTSLILISKDSIKMKGGSVTEEQSGALRSEWDISDVVSIESHWSNVANIAKVKLHLLTKDAVRAETAQGKSGVEVLEFLVHDPEWSLRQDQIMSLNVSYQAAWSIGMKGKSCDGDAFPVETSECSSDPYIPNFEEPFEEVVYPEGDVDAVSISKRDVDLLQPEIFINDTIIDFYTKYLKNGIPPQERHRFHFFNSFFFRKLADLDKNPSSDFDSKAAFQRVRKWTRKVNIFEKDYIFIPVNYNLHWSLIVICHPGDVANFNDKNVDESFKVPCILHMDSIRGSHTGLKDIVQSYLLEEWKERQKETSDEIYSKFLNLRFLSLELPQQENYSDCGLFLLHYAELFIAEAPADFSPFMINKFENFLKPDWFMPAEASLKRVHIQRLIYALLESHSQGSGSPFCNRESLPLALPENNENDNSLEIISEKRSPGKPWNGNLSYSQSIQGMEMNLLDVSLYRTSQCIDESGPGMRELFEQCQHYDQGASFERLGCSLSSIKEEEEVEADGNHARLTLGQAGLQPIDGLASGACHIGYSSEDFVDEFAWNSQLSDQEEPEVTSSQVSNCSASDDSEEIRVAECDQERQDASSGQNENINQSKENVDSFTESYASASSDMMETPAEDSQELDKIYGSNDQEDVLPLNVNSEEMLQVQPSQQGDDNKDDNGVLPCVDEKLVVEDSSSDSGDEQTAKRIRLSPSLDEERLLETSLSNDL